jgi:hypothetical protein
MSTALLTGIYLAAIVAANLSVAAFGPPSTIVNAFLFIGLDITARDRLHEAWRGRALGPKMALLIAGGSLVSWAINRKAGAVAMASLVAFAASGAADALVYHLLRRYAWMLKVNGSNLASAAVDSLVFPTLAFGRLIWWVVAGQFVAKVAGGALWAAILRQRRRVSP